MDILHKGFDGLDVSFCATLPFELVDKLEAAKAHAVATGTPAILTIADLILSVAETGARGGYRYQCDTGPLGAVWFFKVPKAGDPWGVRVSCRALPLALRGLEQVRADLYATMDTLGIRYATSGESIARVDYAIDILAPDFSPDPHCFVMHSRTGQATHEELDSRTSNGRSGRITSITIGKTPNRQVILYDKRQEVMDKNKAHWPQIWNANRAKAGKSPLDMADASSSRVWRIEFRAMKKCLKNRGITLWPHLQNRLAECMTDMSERVRYTAPTTDTNRARWPDAPIWSLIRCELARGLAEVASGVPEPLILELHDQHRRRMLIRKMLGVGISAAHLDSITVDNFDDWLDRCNAELKALSRSEKVGLADRLR